MTDTTDDETIAVSVEQMGGEGALSKATNSQQLPEDRINSVSVGIDPPYNPDRLASFLELNETLATGVRKKARYEVGYGFDIVPHADVDPDEASDDERAVARQFWRGYQSKWQTGPKQSAEPTTPAEVKELARQDYHQVGWCCLEILVDLEGVPVGLAHVPANTVRVRKPQTRFEQPRHPEEGTFISTDDADLASRGYVQLRDGRQRYYGEAGDRYRGLEPTITGGGENDTPTVRYQPDSDDDREPIFVDRETGDVVRGSAEGLDNPPANELIFIRNPSPIEQDYGIPDWVSAIRTITADEAAKEYNREFFDNDTIPRFVIKVTGGELTEESKRDLRQMLHGLREESHRTVVLEVEKFQQQLDQDQDIEIELEPLGQGISEEMDFRLFREKNEAEVAKVLELPPIKIGNTGTSNRSNSEVQDREFALEVIQPEQHKFAERLYRTIHQQALGVMDWTIEYELRGAEQPKEDAEVARRKIQAVNGAIPVNRALEMIGEDPLDDDHPVDGDTLVAEIGGDNTPSPGQPPSFEASYGPPDVDDPVEEPRDKFIGDRVTVESSNLAEVGYDELLRVLEIKFHGDRVYQYYEVPPEIHEELLDAPSKGKYHHENIKWEFEYRRIR